MGYDISLHIHTGKSMTEVLDLGNYTYNVSKMYYKAIPGGIKSLHGKSAGESAPIIKAAISDMESNPEEYEKLNPENGWGDYNGAIRFLKDLIPGMEEHPATTVLIS
jgi:hypothetical protein